ncbi:MAG: peptide chain release factor N(5)-glutamine methyltransferase [Methylocystis sp.]|nr:peptide chain release factor N(5)-glutamine methyltransferase [Methylocystis sp.]
MKLRVLKKRVAPPKPEPVTSRIEAIEKIVAFLKEEGAPEDEARDDARAFVLAATKISRLELAMTPRAPLSDEEARLLTDFATRRAAREPVSRILGARGFWTLDLIVEPGVMDPRPDTEALVETTLALIADRREAPLNILDLGCGSGAVLCALLSELPNATGVAVDLSADACAATKANLGRCKVSGRANVMRGNWADAIASRFDIVVSNPPYVRSGDIVGLEPEVRLHDPALALDGGEDGLDCYRAIIADAPRLLAEDALLAFEVGSDQAVAVAGLLGAQGFSIARIGRDAGGHERVVAAQLAGQT